MKQTELRFVKPREDSRESEAVAAGRRVGKLLDELERLDWHIATGELVGRLQLRIITSPRAEGWRVTVDVRDRWQVLPPEDY